VLSKLLSVMPRLPSALPPRRQGLLLLLPAVLLPRPQSLRHLLLPLRVEECLDVCLDRRRFLFPPLPRPPHPHPSPQLLPVDLSTMLLLIVRQPRTG